MSPSKKNKKKNRRQPNAKDSSIQPSRQRHGPAAAESLVLQQHQQAAAAAAEIKGSDDCGRFYHSHDELERAQRMHREEYYAANALYWINGGYGGSTDDEAMVGDTDGLADGVEGLAFLDRLLAQMDSGANNNNNNNHHKTPRRAVAVDLGAGVGRVTKLILLKRYQAVRLVEGDDAYSKQSRVYLGRKRAAKCTFTHLWLQDLNDQTMEHEWGGEPVDLMWIQWCLQYLTDEDVVQCLKTLAGKLRLGLGVLVVKENRPFGTAREDRFQMDTPRGESLRYDITRPDLHHRLLFQKAGLSVDLAEQGVETNTYALRKIP
mmetsp:Transcript_26130/g.72048  ORF Transcript_26130/g.72048 Transcript_26130/m.72048 type:complete len:319 (-) Transcript_26130:173-1129(-)